MKNILAAIDFSETSAKVIAVATEQAKAFNAKLWLTHATQTRADIAPFVSASLAGSEVGVDLSGASYPYYDVFQVNRDDVAEELRQEHAKLLDIVNNAKKQGVDAVGVLARGPAVEVIISKASKFNADLLVIGSHGHGFIHRALLGGVFESILRTYQGQMLVVPIYTEAS